MKLVDWDAYKFRCHALGKIMTGANKGLTEKQMALMNDYSDRYNGNGRPLTANQLAVLGDLLKRFNEKPTLSTTAKSYLVKLWAETTFEKSDEMESKYLDKGISVEEDSITLYSNVVGMPFFKNKDRKENHYISGEPDNTYKGVIRDIKSSWDHTTFPYHEKSIPNNDYYWQLMGYMWLWGYKKAELIYCLVDTPEELITDELWRTARKCGYVDLPDFIEQNVRKRMTFSDIPEFLRVRVFPLEYDEAAKAAIVQQIKIARKFLNDVNENFVKMSEHQKGDIAQIFENAGL